MRSKFRDGTLLEEKDSQEKLLEFLYGTICGRSLLKLLVNPGISKLAGRFLSSRVSTVLIGPFIKKYKIDMKIYEKANYQSYNEFFSRKICPRMRPVDMDPTHLISPCDSKLTAARITENSCFCLKHTSYTIGSLLRSHRLSREYEGGWALIFRLTVDDYHRYCYVADGIKGKNIRIPGVLHTVNPIANDRYPIYKENSREYSILHTKEFGNIVMMEVGALLVGRIVNHHEKERVKRGQEKGFFQFGGSTIVLLVKSGKLRIDEDIIKNSREGIETIVKMGEKIGEVYEKENRTGKFS